jgi:hypothetical protein
MKHTRRSGLPNCRCYTPGDMRRWLLIFLVVLLPMQFGWAAVASYAHHESGAATAQHVGHHEHQHEADTGTKSTAASSAADADCGTCHAGCCTAMVPTSLLLVAELPAETHYATALRLSSQPASLPERPNWTYPA